MIVYYPKGSSIQTQISRNSVERNKKFRKTHFKILFKLLRLSSFPEIRKFWKFSVPLGFSTWYNLILVFLVVSVKKNLDKANLQDGGMQKVQICMCGQNNLLQPEPVLD